MAQLNPNPNCTSNTTGYSVTGGGGVTLTATTNGLRVQKAADIPDRFVGIATDFPNNAVLQGWRVRRNSSTSQTPVRFRAGGSAAWYAAGVWGASGAQVTYPKMTYNRTSSLSRIEIELPDGPCDFYLTGMNVYDAGTAPAYTWALDGNESAFTVEQSDGSLTATVQISGTYDEAVNWFEVKWPNSSPSYRGTYSLVGPASPSRPPALVYTYLSAGLYTITHTASFLQDSPTILDSHTSTQQIMVPVGPFVAAYSYSASNLVLSVDASTSQVPTYDTISSYTWEWGDGSPNGSGVTASHTYAEPGTYSVKLTTRTPATLRESTETKLIAVELPPTPPADLTGPIANSIFAGRFSSWNVNTRVDELPTPIDFSLAVPADDLPALTMTYSLKGEGGAGVRDLVGQEYDLGFEVFNPASYQWFEPRGCRWVVQDDAVNLMDATGMVKLKGVGVVDDLDGLIVTDRVSESLGRAFRPADGSVTIGRVMGSLLESEIANYGHVITRDFTSTHDSSTTAFARSLNSTYEVGSSQTFLQVLRDLTEMDLGHWSTQGNELLLFDDASPEYGLDLAFGGAGDVHLLPGREVKAIQTSRTRRDYVSRLFIPGTAGSSYYVRNSAEVGRRGRRAQLLSGRVATPADADLVAAGILGSTGSVRREQYTYELNLSSRLAERGALPFVDYNPGDTIWAVNDSGSMEPMVVQQITISGRAGEPLSGSVILSDRLILQGVQRARSAARALGAGARFSGGESSSTDTGWVTITPSSGYGFQSGYPLQIRRVGNLVKTRGLLTRTGGWTAGTQFTGVIAAIPAEFCPSQGEFFSGVGNTSHPNPVIIWNADGSLVVRTQSTVTPWVGIAASWFV